MITKDYLFLRYFPLNPHYFKSHYFYAFALRENENKNIDFFQIWFFYCRMAPALSWRQPYHYIEAVAQATAFLIPARVLSLWSPTQLPRFEGKHF